MKIALTYILTQKWMSDDESIGVDNKIVTSRTKLQQLYNSRSAFSNCQECRNTFGVLHIACALNQSVNQQIN